MGNAALKFDFNDTTNESIKQKRRSYSKVNVSHPLDNIFSSNSYFIEQPFVQITREGYKIYSADKSKSFQAVRNRSWTKRFLARLGGLLGFFVTFIGLSALVVAGSPKSSPIIPPGLSIIIFFPLSIMCYVWVSKILSPKRVTTLYGKGKKTIFKITPKSGEFIFNKEFYLKDQNNKRIIVFKRSFIDSFFRKKWHVYTVKGKYMFSAVEDNILLALLRRYLRLGRFIPLNFHFVKGNSKPFGIFKRKFSLRDKYKLSFDPRAIPAWITVATAILLDTGEER